MSHATKDSIRIVDPLRRNHPLLGLATHEQCIVAVGGLGTDLVLWSDDGESFRRCESPGKGLRGAFLSQRGLWVVGERGYMARTGDQGKTWERIDTNTKSCLFAVSQDSEGNLWTAGDDGYLAMSSNGDVFHKLDGVAESIARISASSLGVLIPTDTPGHLYIGSNRSVHQTGLHAGADLMAATVTPMGTLLAVGKSGVFRSADAGRRFEKGELPTSEWLTAIECFTDGRVVVVGRSGVILLSSDDGRSFGRVEHEFTTDTLWCCKRYGEDIFVGGTDGLVVRIAVSYVLSDSAAIAKAKADARADLRTAALAALAHGPCEAFATALARLEGFASAGERLGFRQKQQDLKIDKGIPLTAADIQAIESSLEVQLPPSLAEFLQTIGHVKVTAPNSNKLTTWATAYELARHTGQVHDYSYFAELYGKTAETFDPRVVEAEFVRISLGCHFIEDEDEHEDGDVVTLIVDRSKSGEVAVWDLPFDDTHGYERRGNNVHEWFTYIIDRVIRYSYIFWSGRYKELHALGGRADFDDGLGGEK